MSIVNFAGLIALVLAMIQGWKLETLRQRIIKLEIKQKALQNQIDKLSPYER